MRIRFAAALGVAALFTLSCGGVTDPSKNKVETFNDTLLGNRGQVFNFNASNSGEFTVMITALSPLNNTFVGIDFGQVINGSCGLLQETEGVLNTPALSGPIVPGTYCVQLFDVVGFATPENVTVSVSHP
jgi:hypothetical protein